MKRSLKCKEQLTVLLGFLLLNVILVIALKLLPASFGVALVVLFISVNLAGFFLISRVNRSVIPVVRLRKSHMGPVEGTYLFPKKYRYYRAFETIVVGSQEWEIMELLQKEGRFKFFALHKRIRALLPRGRKFELVQVSNGCLFVFVDESEGEKIHDLRRLLNSELNFEKRQQPTTASPLS